MPPRVPLSQNNEASTTSLLELPTRGHARTLAVLAGHALRSYRLPEGGSLSIGRVPTNDVCIDHPSVSRRHATLHVGPPLEIEDLGGANGTFVSRPGKPEDSGEKRGLKIERRAMEVEVGDCI